MIVLNVPKVCFDMFIGEGRTTWGLQEAIRKVVKTDHWRVDIERQLGNSGYLMDEYHVDMTLFEQGIVVAREDQAREDYDADHRNAEESFFNV